MPRADRSSSLLPELDDALLDRIADRIADKLAARATGEVIDAIELAQRLHRSREFVYSNADRLGAIRLGDGPRPRLAFRWPQVLDRLDGSVHLADTPPPPETRSRRRTPTPTSTTLLPIRQRELSEKKEATP